MDKLYIEVNGELLDLDEVLEEYLKKTKNLSNKPSKSPSLEDEDNKNNEGTEN